MSTAEKRLLINLRIIAGLLPHQKINAKSDLLIVEPPSWLPESLYRWFRGDTREICLRRLEELISEAISSVEQAGRLNDRKKQKKFLSHVFHTIPGFQSLKQTYAYDATTVANIELFIEQCGDVLSQYNYEQDRLVAMNELPVSDDSEGDETDDSEDSVKKRLGPKIGQEQWRSKVGRVLN